MKQNYSDRDYFDDKFDEIDKRFSHVETKLDKIHKAIYGNGEVGMIEQVRNNKKDIQKAFFLIMALLPFQIKESRDLVIAFFKMLVGL
jgi:formyltetrahydrofolate synthetase